VAFFRRDPHTARPYLPTLSIIVPARNEQAHIGAKIRELLDIDYPSESVEIIVVSDGSTDRTDEVVRGFSNPRVSLIRIPVQRGKTNAQNRGASVARNEVLVFSDATAAYDRSALRHLASHYSDPSVGGVSGRYEYRDPAGRSRIAIGAVAFWKYENMIKRLQSRIRTLTGCSGCIYSVRRSLYTHLQDDQCSDLVQPLQLAQKGYRVIFEDRALAYEDVTRTPAEEFHMRVRVVTHGVQGLASMPGLLSFRRDAWVAWQLLSHKVFRWAAPILLNCAVLATLGSASPGYRRFGWTLLSVYLCGLISFLIPIAARVRALNLPLYICTLNLALLVGLFSACRRRRWGAWETVRN